MIRFDNWTLTHDGEIIARQFDHKTRSITITGDIPSGWNWDLLVKVKEAGAFDIIPLTASEDGLSVVLTEKQLSIAGYYTLQLRGNQGEPKKHTNQLEDVYIPASLSGDAHWPELPTKFSEMEARVKADADRAAAAAGKAGRYYMPKVTQPSASTMQMSFTPSEPEMTEVNSVKVNLPAGPKGEDGCGVEKYAFDPEIWRWVMTYTDGHIDTYSGHSPHDKYKFVIWRDDFTPGRDNVDWGVGNTALTDNAGEYYSTHPTTASRQQGVVEMNGEYVARLWSANGKYCRLVTKCHSWGAYTAQMDFMMNAPTGGASAPGLVLNLFEGYSFGSGNILAYLENAYGSRITDTTSGSDVHCWMNDSSGNRLKWTYDTWYTVKLSCKVGSITMSVWERGTDEKKAWTITYESDIITTKAIEAEKAFRIHSRKSSVSGTHNTVYLDNLMLWEDTFAQLEDALDSIITIQEALIGGNAT